MSLGATAVQAIYLAVAIVGFALALVLWRNAGRIGAVPLALVNVSLAWWSLCLFVSMIAPDRIAILAIRLMYLGVLGVPIIMFIFGLVYTGRERFVTKRILALIAVHPVVSLAFVFFNPSGLFFRELDPTFVFGVEQVWGPAFWAHTFVSYAFATGLTLMILELVFLSERSLYRSQAVVLLLAIIAPWIANIVFIAEIVPFDSTPIGFGVSTALFTFAIIRYQLGDIVPIARNKVVDSIRDGMFVLDPQDRIVDTNPPAQALAGAPADVLLGESMYDVFADYPGVIETYDTLTAETTPDERTLEVGNMIFTVEATPIRDDRGRHSGWLLIIEDDSEAERTKRQLEQQVEQLEKFASIVSHDLRNPMAVAKAYIQHARSAGETDKMADAEAAIERMEAIIEDVLTLAREGQDVTEPEQTALESVVREAWNAVETRGATLEAVSLEDVRLMADRNRLQRLLENLFRNSVDHGLGAGQTDADQDDQGDGQGDEDQETAGENPPALDAWSAGDLTITVFVESETGSQLSLVVADDGVGIPTDEREHVFEDGYSTAEEGTGLGLAIVRQIAHAHGWEVSVGESEAGGAAFVIEGIGKPLPGTRFE